MTAAAASRSPFDPPTSRARDRVFTRGRRGDGACARECGADVVLHASTREPPMPPPRSRPSAACAPPGLVADLQHRDASMRSSRRPRSHGPSRHRRQQRRHHPARRRRCVSRPRTGMPYSGEPVERVFASARGGCPHGGCGLRQDRQHLRRCWSFQGGVRVRRMPGPGASRMLTRALATMWRRRASTGRERSRPFHRHRQHSRAVRDPVR